MASFMLKNSDGNILNFVVKNEISNPNMDVDIEYKGNVVIIVISKPKRLIVNDNPRNS